MAWTHFLFGAAIQNGKIHFWQNVLPGPEIIFVVVYKASQGLVSGNVSIENSSRNIQRLLSNERVLEDEL